MGYGHCTLHGSSMYQMDITMTITAISEVVAKVGKKRARGIAPILAPEL